MDGADRRGKEGREIWRRMGRGSLVDNITRDSNPTAPRTTTAQCEPLKVAESTVGLAAVDEPRI